MTMAEKKRAANPHKVWASLITNMSYLPGLLTLDYSLKKSKSAYQLIAFYTDQFPIRGRDALRARNIPTKRVEYLLPENGRDYAALGDARFIECWSKLAAFGMTQYRRVVLLDSDMLVLRNMDELMDIPLEGDEEDNERGDRENSHTQRGVVRPGRGRNGDLRATERKRGVFAAAHACLCNPLRKSQYPRDWIPSNCVFTSQHEDPDSAQHTGADPSVSPALGHNLNSGLLVIRPNAALYAQILEYMEANAIDMDFPDQSLLSEMFRGRWTPLSYVYNALKTLRWPGVHDAIWRDNEVKNVHYIFSPKPWDELNEKGETTRSEESHKWWASANRERLAWERKCGIVDDTI